MKSKVLMRRPFDSDRTFYDASSGGMELDLPQWIMDLMYEPTTITVTIEVGDKLNG